MINRANISIDAVSYTHLDNFRLYESVGYVEYKREQIDDRLTDVYKRQVMI